MNSGTSDERMSGRPLLPWRVRLWLSIIGLLVGLVGGFLLSRSAGEWFGIDLFTLQLIGIVLIGGLLGVLALSFILPFLFALLITFGKWIEERLLLIPLSDILAGVLGLTLGLMIANLLSGSFGRIPWIGTYAPVALAIVLGYVGWVVAVHKKPDLLAWGRTVRAADWFGRESQKTGTRDSSGRTVYPQGIAKVLDSSAIIDGRIADVCRTGFLEGPLVIPKIVLEEVQRIADSSDGMKRSRGRRGLDILNLIQQDLDVEVQVYEENSVDGQPVDSQLLQIARVLGGKIVTNDYNLNKVAVLQGIGVLNINELANAMKPMVIPGEDMDIFVLREGKEPGQGVGYLDDGTMVVVDEGSSKVGQSIPVIVTSVLQTAAGRMIFCRPKEATASET